MFKYREDFITKIRRTEELLKKTFRLLCVLFCAVMLTGFVSAAYRLEHNGFVSAAGGGPRSTHIATGWTLGFPVGGLACSKSNEIELTACYWSQVALAEPPPAPPVLTPTNVLGGATGEYFSVGSSIQVSGLKPPGIDHYDFNSYVIVYTNEVEMPLSTVNQTSNSTVWNFYLNLSEDEEVELSLATSNTFGFSTSRTILYITQIPEPLLLLPLFFLLFLRKRFKKFIYLFILVIVVFSATESYAIGFNYQGMLVVEDGAYTGAGYFKFAITDKNNTTNYWANDGTSTGEPLGAVNIDVSNGFFHTTIGGGNMLPIPRRFFTSTNEFYLCIWFNHVPVNGFNKLGPPQLITPVPMTLNSDLLDGYDYKEIFYNVQTNSLDMFLLRTGDVCSGELQVSNLVSDTDVKLSGDVIVNEEKKVYLNGDSKSAYISAKPGGNITIYKNDKPVFEIE